MTPQQSILEQARLALQRGSAELALRTCEALLSVNSRDVAARHLRGRCAAALGMLDEAARDFSKALAAQPTHFAALADLGVALAALGRHQQASEQLAAALARDDRPAELHFALGQCRFACGQLRSAADSFAAAIARRPDFADAYNNLGVVLDRLGDLDTAIRHFERARALQPMLIGAHRNLAQVLRRRGRLAEAADVLACAIALEPHDTELQCELAEVLMDSGRADAALSAAEVALSRAPGNARAHAVAGMALLSANRCAEAVPCLEQALRLDPGLGYVAVNLGEALLRLERPEAAAKAFRASLSVSDLPEAHLGLGRALEQLGELQKAATVLEHAATKAPADGRIQHALGAFLHRRGRVAEAATNYERALGLEPRQLRWILDRGNALESLGRLDEAVAAFEAALGLEARCAEALAGLVSCAFRLCDWSALDAYLPRLQALPDGTDALHPFLVLALDLSPAQQLRALERRAAVAPPLARVSSVPGRSHAPLRVAYLSPDFREHAVAHALVAVVEAHDRARLQPVGVSLAASDESAVGARLRSAFDRVIDASALSDSEILARMRELEIDIAVDLAGYTSGGRPGLFAARCAPVQVNYLGFSATTGASFMDYIIADEVVIPRTDESAYSERVLRLPHCYLPLDSTRRIAPGTSDRATSGLPESGVVFCAFNNSYKITRDMFRLWMSLLRDVPGSVLWLRRMDSRAAHNLQDAAAGLGVEPPRLVFAPHVQRTEEYLGLLQLADLFLDTLPYNAHTTAADALWAGVPLLTCRGQSFAGRVGASLLNTAGLPDLVCSSLEDYRATALRLAAEPVELRAMRRRVSLARDSGAFDAQRYARNLEALYDAMWSLPHSGG
jgi:predicted O-linked N-acetylglucosamine transferase (SPINDLY family)